MLMQLTTPGTPSFKHSSRALRESDEFKLTARLADDKNDEK